MPHSHTGSARKQYVQSVCRRRHQALFKVSHRHWFAPTSTYTLLHENSFICVAETADERTSTVKLSFNPPIFEMTSEKKRRRIFLYISKTNVDQLGTTINSLVSTCCSLNPYPVKKKVCWPHPHRHCYFNLKTTQWFGSKNTSFTCMHHRESVWPGKPGYTSNLPRHCLGSEMIRFR